MESLDPLALSPLRARAQRPAPPRSPEQGGIYFLSLSVSVFWTFYDWNWITCVFCGWLLALNIVDPCDGVSLRTAVLLMTESYLSF